LSESRSGAHRNRRVLDCGRVEPASCRATWPFRAPPEALDSIRTIADLVDAAFPPGGRRSSTVVDDDRELEADGFFEELDDQHQR